MSDIRKIVRSVLQNGGELVNRETRHRLSWVHDSINERAALEKRVISLICEGQIGVIVDEMDCDCTQSYREYTKPFAGLFALQSNEQKAQSEAEGPRYVSYARPEEVRVGYYRTSDRALAAYEDGHASTVTWEDLGPRAEEKPW